MDTESVLAPVAVPLVPEGFNPTSVVTEAIAELLGGTTDEVERIAD